MAATRKRRSTSKSKGKGKPIKPLGVFADALDARIRPLCAEHDLDPEPLVRFLARAAEADVKALVPAQYQDAVLSSPTLAERWPLTSGNISASKDQPELESLAPLIRRHLGTMAWPTTVTYDEVAGLLDNLNPSATVAQRRTAACMAWLIREPHRMMPVVSALDGEPAPYWALPTRGFTEEALNTYRNRRSPFTNLFVLGRDPGFAFVYYIDDLTPQQLGVPGDELETYEGFLRAFTDERFSADDFLAVASENEGASLSSALMLIPLLSILGRLFLPTENEAEDDGSAVTPEKTLARLRALLHGDEPRATLQEIRDELARRMVFYQAIATWDSFAVAWIAATLREVREAEQARKPPALVQPVYSTVALDFHSRSWFRDFDPARGQVTFAGREIAQLAGVAGVTFDLDVILRGLGLLGSLAAHRLFRWEVRTGHDQHLAGQAYPHILEVDGGWTGLAKAIGLPRPDRVAGDVRALVYSQAHFQFLFPDGARGNLLSYQERDARGRTGRAHVTITLGAPLLPGYVHTLTQRDRKLVPLLRDPVPLCGRTNDHGQQLTMSLAVVGEFRERAVELARDGSVRLTPTDFDRLGDRAGVPPRTRPLVLRAWLDGDARADPFLEQVARDRYTLAEPRRLERDFIVDAGQRELEGAQAGTKSARARRARVHRQAGK